MMLTFVHWALVQCFISVLSSITWRKAFCQQCVWRRSHPRPWINLIFRGIIIVCDIKVILSGAVLTMCFVIVQGGKNAATSLHYFRGGVGGRVGWVGVTQILNKSTYGIQVCHVLLPVTSWVVFYILCSPIPSSAAVSLLSWLSSSPSMLLALKMLTSSSSPSSHSQVCTSSSDQSASSSLE